MKLSKVERREEARKLLRRSKRHALKVYKETLRRIDEEEE